MLSTVLCVLALSSQEPNQAKTVQVKPFKATTVSGKSVMLPDKKAKATVLVFLLTDCPIANRYAPELRRIEEKYSKLGVKFYRVYVYGDIEAEEIAEHTKDYGYKSASFHDKGLKLTKKFSARVTPEVAVMTAEGKIQYMGRVDDMYVEHGRLRETEFRQDLRIALDEVLAGKKVSIPRTTALGCFIEY